MPISSPNSSSSREVRAHPECFSVIWRIHEKCHLMPDVILLLNLCVVLKTLLLFFLPKAHNSHTCTEPSSRHIPIYSGVITSLFQMAAVCTQGSVIIGAKSYCHYCLEKDQAPGTPYSLQSHQRWTQVQQKQASGVGQWKVVSRRKKLRLQQCPGGHRFLIRGPLGGICSSFHQETELKSIPEPMVQCTSASDNVKLAGPGGETVFQPQPRRMRRITLLPEVTQTKDKRVQEWWLPY